jgi:hypothetical protein
MTLYAFVIGGVPGFRTTLDAAQGAVEDHYVDRGYSHLEWGEQGGEQYGAYIWEFGGEEPAPYESQLIWPWDGAGPADDASEDHSGLGPLELCEAELTMTVRTRTSKTQFVRCYGAQDWNEDRLRPHLITTFATRAGLDLAKHLSKEGT